MHSQISAAVEPPGPGHNSENPSTRNPHPGPGQGRSRMKYPLGAPKNPEAH